MSVERSDNWSKKRIPFFHFFDISHCSAHHLLFVLMVVILRPRWSRMTILHLFRPCTFQMVPSSNTHGSHTNACKWSVAMEVICGQCGMEDTSEMGEISVPVTGLFMEPRRCVSFLDAAVTFLVKVHQSSTQHSLIFDRALEPTSWYTSSQRWGTSVAGWCFIFSSAFCDSTRWRGVWQWEITLSPFVPPQATGWGPRISTVFVFLSAILSTGAKVINKSFFIWFPPFFRHRTYILASSLMSCVVVKSNLFAPMYTAQSDTSVGRSIRTRSWCQAGVSLP